MQAPGALFTKSMGISESGRERVQNADKTLSSLGQSLSICGVIQKRIGAGIYLYLIDRHPPPPNKVVEGLYVVGGLPLIMQIQPFMAISHCGVSSIGLDQVLLDPDP